MAVWGAEVKAMAALVTVELSLVLVKRICCDGNVPMLYPCENGIEFFIAHMKGVVLRRDCFSVVEIEIDASSLDHGEPTRGGAGIFPADR